VRKSGDWGRKNKQKELFSYQKVQFRNKGQTNKKEKAWVGAGFPEGRSPLVILKNERKKI